MVFPWQPGSAPSCNARSSCKYLLRNLAEKHFSRKKTYDDERPAHSLPNSLSLPPPSLSLSPSPGHNALHIDRAEAERVKRLQVPWCVPWVGQSDTAPRSRPQQAHEVRRASGQRATGLTQSRLSPQAFRLSNSHNTSPTKPLTLA